jgi:hypothetical protein
MPDFHHPDIALGRMHALALQLGNAEVLLSTGGRFHGSCECYPSVFFIRNPIQNVREEVAGEGVVLEIDR